MRCKERIVSLPYIYNYSIVLRISQLFLNML
jgi:hypothetical protein